MKIAGIILVVMGVLGLAYGGFSYTQEKKIVDIGKLEINKEKTETIPIPPIIGGVCLAAGIALIIIPGRKS